MHIFASVSQISHKYVNKELYVIKRLWYLIREECDYTD